jgi:hypothetical protein
VKVPDPIVSVSVDSNLVNLGQPVKVSWRITDNYSSDTTCKGSFSENGDTSRSFDFIKDGRVSGVTTVSSESSCDNITPKVSLTNYVVTCTNVPAPVVATGSCSGTYTLKTGVCSGTRVIGSMDADGNVPGPLEGELCSNISQSVCGVGWLTHGCSGWVSTTTYPSCSGFSSQSYCLTHSGCVWN